MQNGIEAEGYYSLLTDKNTSIIARKPDGTPIRAVSGGCTNNDFCEAADPTLLMVIKARSNDKSGTPTPKQQNTYRQLNKEGHVKIVDDHAQHQFVMPSDWRDMP